MVLFPSFTLLTLLAPMIYSVVKGSHERDEKGSKRGQGQGTGWLPPPLRTFSADVLARFAGARLSLLICHGQQVERCV